MSSQFDCTSIVTRFYFYSVVGVILLKGNQSFPPTELKRWYFIGVHAFYSALYINAY